MAAATMAFSASSALLEPADDVQATLDAVFSLIDSALTSPRPVLLGPVLSPRETQETATLSSVARRCKRRL